MSIKFDLFHLSLTERNQVEMFGGSQITRESYLRSIFEKPQTFEHFKVQYQYVPAPEHPLSGEILGRIGKRITIEANLPPEEGLIETEDTLWKAAYLVIDPMPHEEGQRLAMEVDVAVSANPTSLLASLIDAINKKNSKSQYHVDLSPIVHVGDFWAFVQKHEGKVTSVSLDFVPPNMWGTSDEISEELKRYHDLERASGVSIRLRSDDGLEPDTPRTREAVEYIARGQGGIRATAKTSKGRRTYSSKRRGKSVSLDMPPEKAGKMFIRWIIDHLQAILDHE